MLVVESYPRWEYRYLRNALSRDPGVDVSCLLFHPGLTKVGGGNKDYIKQFPSGLDELSRYDVVFLGDVGTGDGQLTAEQCRLLKGLVRVSGQRAGLHARHGGAAVLAAGDGAWRSLSRGARRGPARRLGLPYAQPLRADGKRPGQPADQAGRYAGRQHRGLGGLARVPVVRAGAPVQGRQRGARRAQGRGQRVRPPSPAGHPDIRHRQGALHGHRRRLAVAQGGRGQVPLPFLGPGGAVDGLPAEHGQGRDDAAVLRARPAAR